MFTDTTCSASGTLLPQRKANDDEAVAGKELPIEFRFAMRQRLRPALTQGPCRRVNRDQSVYVYTVSSGHEETVEFLELQSIAGLTVRKQRFLVSLISSNFLKIRAKNSLISWLTHATHECPSLHTVVKLGHRNRLKVPVIPVSLRSRTAHLSHAL